MISLKNNGNQSTTFHGMHSKDISTELDIGGGGGRGKQGLFGRHTKAMLTKTRFALCRCNFCTETGVIDQPTVYTAP